MVRGSLSLTQHACAFPAWPFWGKQKTSRKTPLMLLLQQCISVWEESAKCPGNKVLHIQLNLLFLMATWSPRTCCQGEASEAPSMVTATRPSP